MIKLILFISVGLSSIAGAAEKSQCTVKETAGRDCHLRTGELELDLLDKTIAWNDGTWRSVDPMPLSGEGVEWEKITFTRVGGQTFLQMWIWDKGVGEMQVQSLHWFVSRLRERKLRVVAEGVVRKRHLEQPLVAASGTAPQPKPKYLNDAMEKHEFRATKKGEFEWAVGAVRKTIVAP